MRMMDHEFMTLNTKYIKLFNIIPYNESFDTQQNNVFFVVFVSPFFIFFTPQHN